MKKWRDVALGLHNMNGALDEDYRLPINTKEWNSKDDSYIVWICDHCTTTKKVRVDPDDPDNKKMKEIQVPTQSKREDIRIFTERCSQVVRILSGHKTRKMWECPKCKTVASVDTARLKRIKYAEPHYRGCIYQEPELPLTGLERRKGNYPEEMRKWAKYYSMELEHQLALYRLEYIKEHGVDPEFDYKDTGD